jgi:hypothetical protein
MSALVVVETYFGNTRHIADVVANRLRSDGIDAEVVNVVEAPTELEDGIELLVIGAPTHDLGLPTAKTRQAAFARSGQVEPGIGAREWVQRVTRPSVPAVERSDAVTRALSHRTCIARSAQYSSAWSRFRRSNPRKGVRALSLVNRGLGVRVPPPAPFPGAECGS